MYVELIIYGRHILALLDTGASRTVLRRTEFDLLCKTTGRTPVLKKAVPLCGVTGHDIAVLGITEIEEVTVGPFPVIIVEGIAHALILGRDLLCNDGAYIDYATGRLNWRGVNLPLLPAPGISTLSSLGERPPLMESPAIKLCVKENEDLFAAKGEPLGCHPGISIRIETEGPPIKRRPYRIPLTKKAALDKKIDELLAEGVIVPSSSPWASPVVLVEKKDPSEGPRFCIDFTALNKVTKRDAFPIPLIRDIFDQLHGATIFSTMDLKSGFHQLPLHPDDREKTAFVSHRGLHEWTRLPMGLCNASQKFQRAMEVVLKGLIGPIALLYIDDVVVFSRNEAEHVDHLRQVFQRLRQYNLRLNPAKCVFGLREVKLLGYLVSEKGLRADPDKVAAIARMQPPQDLPQIRSFLGMAGYYRTCIPDFAKVAEPLVALTRKHARFIWTQEHHRAFETLKQALTSDTVMAHPRCDQEYKLYTDACDYAIGAILCQTDDLGVERPVVYLSKQLSSCQRRWPVIEKEAYAVVQALKQLRPYLWNAQYTTYTDHKPLCSLFTKEMNNTKIQRWAVLLAEYDCKIKYHKGRLNIRADMLSRIRQVDAINTFDADYWHLEDALPDLPEDLTIKDIYDLDLQQLAADQRDMDLWDKHLEDDSGYEVINGLLYSTIRPHKYATDHPRLVLPPTARQKVIKLAHLDVGHMAALKTLRKVQEAFVWPSMIAEVKAYVRTCATCAVHSKQPVKPPMGEMPLPKAPMQVIAMDLIGPLVKTPQGNQYILSIIDHCTGFGEAYALPSKTSRAVWEKLSREFLPRHGFPDVCITDRGLEFGAKALSDYLKALGIDHRQTTCFHPQANGKCERYNSTLKGIITRLINNTRDSWEDQLGPALMAYNNSVSVSTGHTPYFLHFGRRARLPIARLLKRDALLDTRLHDVAEALRHASEATRESRIHNRERLARQANTGDLHVGDTVVVKANQPLTLTSHWDPNFTVTKTRGKVIWVVHQQTGKQKVLNRDKVRLVDPNIVWDEVNPRPIRNPRVSARLVTGPAPLLQQLEDDPPEDEQQQPHPRAPQAPTPEENATEDRPPDSQRPPSPAWDQDPPQMDTSGPHQKAQPFLVTDPINNRNNPLPVANQDKDSSSTNPLPRWHKKRPLESEGTSTPDKLPRQRNQKLIPSRQAHKKAALSTGHHNITRSQTNDIYFDAIPGCSKDLPQEPTFQAAAEADFTKQSKPLPSTHVFDSEPHSLLLDNTPHVPGTLPTSSRQPTVSSQPKKSANPPKKSSQGKVATKTVQGPTAQQHTMITRSHTQAARSHTSATAGTAFQAYPDLYKGDSMSNDQQLSSQINQSVRPVTCPQNLQLRPQVPVSSPKPPTQLIKPPESLNCPKSVKHALTCQPLPSSHRFNIQPASKRVPAQKRDRGPEFDPSHKRTRVYLPRGTKRATGAPPLAVQKKARVEAIHTTRQQTSIDNDHCSHFN